MGRYQVKVTFGKGGFYVMASLPTGVFTRGPMPEQDALRVALDLQRKMKLSEQLSWWQRLWFRRKPPEEKVLPSEPPTCSRHLQWKAERAGGKWVCGFCRKPLNNESPLSEEAEPERN